MAEAWNAADVDGDGKLNLEEFTVWVTQSKAKEREAGVYSRPDDPAIFAKTYNLVNAISEGEGIVMNEFFMFMGPWMAVYDEMIGIPPAALE